MLEKLTQLFEDCADAIREKVSKNEKMKPSEMAEGIKSIVSRPPVASGEYYQPVMGSEGIYPATASIMFFGTPLPASRLANNTDTQFITLLEDVTEIPNYFIQETTAVRDIEIDGKITKIGYGAFDGSSLNFFYTMPIGETVLKDEYKNTIPDGVSIISSTCFRNATKLSPGITWHDNITEIQQAAFYLDTVGTTIKSTKLPAKLTTIGQNAFYNQQVNFDEIPANVETIGLQAFYQNLSLKTLTFKGTPDYIAPNAFANCNALTTINVPWAQGAVANAPWGATNATINYNYTA